MSEVNDYLERSHTNLDHGDVIGDSAYALKKFFDDPIRTPEKSSAKALQYYPKNLSLIGGASYRTIETTFQLPAVRPSCATR